MTPTAVGLVLVEGHGADGEIMDQDAFDVPTRRGATAISTSEYVAGAMSRTCAMAHGRRPHAIGVTWSDESELEASLLLKSLTDAGFDNIVAVRSPEAGEALARGIGRAVGYQQTALCLLEPESVVVSMVDTHDEAVHTVAYHEDDTNRGLIGWLSERFRRERLAPRRPDHRRPRRRSHRARQATRAGAWASRCSHLPRQSWRLRAERRWHQRRSRNSPSESHGLSGIGHQARRRSWSLPYTAALTMLVVGVVAFVVSVSLVAGLKLTSSNGSATAQPAGGRAARSARCRPGRGAARGTAAAVQAARLPRLRQSYLRRRLRFRRSMHPSARPRRCPPASRSRRLRRTPGRRRRPIRRRRTFRHRPRRPR